MVPVSKLVGWIHISHQCQFVCKTTEYVKDFHGVILSGKLEKVVKYNILSKTAGLESLCYSLKETKGL